MIRDVVHRGVVQATAILLDEALLGPFETRRRAVAVWAPGATVHRLGQALLVRLAAPAWIDCARAPGLPLVPIAPESALSTAPLAPDEIAAIPPLPKGAVVRMHAGALTIDRPEDADLEDPATYLDLSNLATIEVKSLGAPPPAATVVDEKKVEARALLGVGEPPPELASLLRVLRAKLNQSSGTDAAAGSGAGSAPQGSTAPSLLGDLFGLFATMIAALFALLGAGRAPSSQSEGQGPPGSYRAPAAAPMARSSSSVVARFEARLRTWLAGLLVRMRLARHIGRRQAEYIQRLLEMFEQGDLTEALRHAIPLGGPAGLPAGPSFGVPRPRNDLRISLGQRSAVAALFASGDLYGELTRLYRKAFERLEREGRIDEAAFVLVELLNAVEEAVAFLERHGRLKAAAELAEARECPPGLVVRQWFLAGDHARAARIARRFGAFPDAIARLKGHPEEPALRVLWAETLANAGDYVAAIDVIWPVVAERPRAVDWIEEVIQQGGAAGAKMLVKKLELFPEAFPGVLSAAQALLGEEATFAPEVRRAFADALLRGPKTPPSITLARPTVRALVEDGGRLGDPATTGLVTRLVAFAGDDALRTDLPAWPAISRPLLKTMATPLEIAIDAADTGSVPVWSAAHLPGGQTVLGLGEAGVRVLHRRPDGPWFHLDQPAHTLVISDHGDRALALAARGDALRIARLDLRMRKTETWCEARIDAFAPDFNGSEWVVAERSRLLVIDVAEARFEALRSTPLDARAIQIARKAGVCSVLTGEIGKSGGLEVSRLRYDVPSWSLRSKRQMLSNSDDNVSLEQLFALDGASAAVLRRAARIEPTVPLRPTLARAREAGAELLVELGSAEDSPLGLELYGAWVACALREKTGVMVRLLDEESLTVRAMITLGGATRACLSLGAETLTVGDDRGRVLVVELEHGSVIRSLRL